MSSLKRWAAVCVAAGFVNPDMDPMDVYILSGKIVNDPVVSRMRMLARKSSVEVIWGMPPNERTALRERVSGVIQFGPPTEKAIDQRADG